MSEKYSIEQKTVENILGIIRNGEVAIPEIQRPFVWKGKQVRDLVGSLFRGSSAGYLIIWQNPDVKLKDGQTSVGKKILIDGRQRDGRFLQANQYPDYAAPRAGSYRIHCIIHPRRRPQAESRCNRRARHGDTED